MSRRTHPIVCFLILLTACGTTPPPQPPAPPVVEQPQRPPEPQGPELAPVVADAQRPAWPPAPLKPMEPIEGDGIWGPVPDFVQGNPGAPPLMVRATLHSRKPGRRPRPGPHPIALLAWDPEQVETRLVAGSREPKLTYPNRGTGTVPRTREVLSRLVASFNGGWMTKHARESGIMWDGTVGRPPGADQATVMLRDDLRVELGTWPKDAPPLPEDVHSFRQNIEPLLDGDTFNPLGREGRWGATGGVRDADGEYTTRSGICRTEEGFMMYVWGRHLDASQLAEAMRRARCAYGMHLDMNSVHAGFDFYRVTDIGPGPKWQPDKLSYNVEGDRLHPDIRYPKPKFLKDRHVKDVFYLLRAPVLPTRIGPVALQPLPRPGSARRHAPALAGLHPDAPEVRVVVWDTHRMKADPGGAAPAEGGLQLALHPGAAPASGATVQFGEGASLVVKALQGAPTPVDGRVALLGVQQGRFALFIEAPAASLDALKAVQAGWPGAQWFELGAGARLDALTPSSSGGWVSYDGVAEQGVLLGESPKAPEGALVFGLPGEEPVVGGLEVGAK